MKAQYDRESDVLMLYMGDGQIDHAEEVDGVIIHFSAADRPILLEVLDAREFLSKLTRITAVAQPGQAVPI